ncbi:MAG: hypothetical protein EA396_01305 [Anaerolineaceae bacterium]|nr:MAG: hypothetical protein EA396_01305 [Anaerolineaceae bacterium]
MQNQSLLEQQLGRDAELNLKNKRTGMFVFQVSWIMAFVCIVIVNWQLRFSANWRPAGTPEASPLIGIFATLALVISAVLVWRAVNAIRADDDRAFILQWGGALALGALFALVMVYEWLTVETGTQYALVFRLMTGFHVVHALAIGLYMALVFRNGARGAYHADHYWAVEAGAKLWYFVLVAWLMFYVVIYWV